MILITGGLGFIGLHTAKELLERGEDLVLTQYRVAREPDFIKDSLGKRAFVEKLDVTDTDALMDIGRRHKITGIVHLAVPALNALSPADDFRVNMNGLLNVMEAARTWEVRRLGLASSVAVYSGASGPFREEMPLRINPGNPTETWKKAFEVIGTHYAQRTGLEIVMLRIAGIYGPLYHSMSNLPSRFVHAAVKGEAPQMRGDTYAEDGGDMCYVRDCGRGIAMLMTAESLPNRVYNIASGRETKNRELAEAVRKVYPNAQLPLKEGRGPGGRENAYADIARIRNDAGYEPRFPVEKAVPDYVEWLKHNPE